MRYPWLMVPSEMAQCAEILPSTAVAEIQQGAKDRPAAAPAPAGPMASGSALRQQGRRLLDQRPALADLPGQACLHAQIAQVGRLLELG